jgi:CRISPR/Cas system-associated exonuclease Cas4 (RecB family)
MGEIKNELSWSKSRDEVLRTCPRKYYFQYYASWGGWLKDADPRTRQIYILKNLDSIPTWIGQKVHDCIEHTVQNLRWGQPGLAVDRIVDVTLKKMRQEYISSWHGRYRERPKSCGLFEHEYGTGRGEDDWRDASEQVEKCLRTFYESDVYARLRALPREAWLEAEEWAHFFLDGVKVWVKLDCAYRGDEGQVVIYDWKTGKRLSEETSLQLSCYALYVGQKWNADAARVIAREYNLFHDDEREFAVTAEDLDATVTYMRAAFDDMRLLLDDAENNVPLPEDRFVRTDVERYCERCNFLRVCRPELLGEDGPTAEAAGP